MGTINSNGIFVYDDTESLSPLSSYMNLQGSALSTRLAQDVRFKKVANEAARTAYVNEVGIANISAANPLAVHRQNAPEGARFEVTYNGTNWNFLATGYETGWLTLSSGTINVRARRSGNVVTVSVDMSTITGVTDDVVILNGGAALIPVDMRPSRQVFGSGTADQPNVTFHAAVLSVQTNGAMFFVKPKSATTGLSGTATYLVG